MHPETSFDTHAYLSTLAGNAPITIDTILLAIQLEEEEHPGLEALITYSVDNLGVYP